VDRRNAKCASAISEPNILNSKEDTLQVKEFLTGHTIRCWPSSLKVEGTLETHMMLDPIHTQNQRQDLEPHTITQECF